MYKKDELIDLLVVRHELSKNEAQEAYKRAAHIGPDRMSPLLDYAVMGLSTVQVAQRIWLMWMTEVFPSVQVT